LKGLILGGHVAGIGESRCVYRLLLEKSGGKRQLGRTKHRWEDNINMYLQEVDCGEWIGLIWLRTRTGGGHL